MGKNYTIGLDIGTASVGWSVIYDDTNDLVKKKMKILGDSPKSHVKKNFWGVRLFEEGQTAESTRLKRTTRRRYTRRRNRIVNLQTLFNEEIEKKDPNFFHRLNESFLVEDDKEWEKHPIFGTIEEEANYHDEFPTIYHLRKKLVDSEEEADIRLIYLALAHMIKYRGHFLIEGKLSTEHSSVEKNFKKFLSEYNEMFSRQTDGSLINPLNENTDIGNNFTDPGSRSKKADRVLALFPTEKSNGTYAQFLKMIVGNQGNFKKTFGLEEDVKLQFSSENYEEDIESLLAQVGDDYSDVFVSARRVYEAIELSGILRTKDDTTKAKLSSSMVERYEEHKDDLKKLKAFFRENLPEKYPIMFKDTTKDGYAGYIEKSSKVSQENFYKFTKKLISKIPGSDYFVEKMDQETFLRKQRTFDNGVIPHQIHLEELVHIIEKQQAYYPFLKVKQEEIKTILTFRIPYYVGPLANGHSSFAWLVRKSEDAITPENMAEVVDMEQSAKGFIERMTNRDSYLPEEKVLPKNSLLYQKYIIFNELTKVSYIDDRGVNCNFSGKEKLAIFDTFFKSSPKKVKEKDIENYLKDEYLQEAPTIKGLEEGFNGHFKTYHDLLKIGVPKEMLDDPTNEDMFEDIINILTIFEDRKMIRSQLAKYKDKFDSNTLKKLERRHYTGWGRLSQKLLFGIKDKESGKTILDFLVEDDQVPRNLNRNFMQLINDSNLSFKDKIKEAQTSEHMDSLEETVKGLTGSPAIKKGILQSLKIVDELVSIMSYPPTSIIVEMARENQTTSQGKRNATPRLKALEKSLGDIGSDLLKRCPTDNQALRDDRLYLYYLQKGKDMYTGQDLDIHRLSHYDIDHIIPRSFTTDNSIDNRVLVSSKDNRGKSDDVPSEEIVGKNKEFWKTLKNAGLMSERKYNNLTKAEREGLTDADKANFLNRQLVETRQITKHVAQILDQRFNHQTDTEGKLIRDVKVITLKSSLVSQFRKSFDMYKVRDINDFHHAHDAYLNAVVANVLLKIYPKLTPDFVYGEYVKGNYYAEKKATAKKQQYINIMEKLAKEERIIVEETAEILWNQKEIGKIKKVLNYHQVNVVKKVEVQTGRFSDETLYPKSNSPSYISRGKNLSPVNYGGFKKPEIAYSVIFEFSKGTKNVTTKEIIGISIMNREIFEQNRSEFLENLGYKEPNILHVLPKYSLFELENGRRRLLASHKESQKGNQMAVPSYLNNLIYHSINISQSASIAYLKEHQNQFDELLTVVVDFAKKFTLADTNLKKIIDLYENRESNELEKIAESFVNLMKFNKMGAPSSFDFFDVNIPRKQYRSTTELLQAKVIYQSITGLYETHKKV